MDEESSEFAAHIVSDELLGDTDAVRRQFVSRFTPDLEEFIAAMAATFLHWKKFDKTIKGSESRAHVSALLYCTLNFHAMSMKLLICGYFIQAGNTERQALESAAMALLCSNANLGILKRYMEDQYSSSKAVRDVVRHHKALGLTRDALRILEEKRSFYDKFSHPTFMTLGSVLGLSNPGPMYFGASFDEGKLPYYAKEIRSRVSFAGIINNIIDGVRHNLDATL